MRTFARSTTDYASALIAVENEYYDNVLMRGMGREKGDDTQLSYVSRIRGLLEYLKEEPTLDQLRRYFGNPVEIPFVDRLTNALRHTHPRCEVIEAIYGTPAIKTKHTASQIAAAASGGVLEISIGGSGSYVPIQYRTRKEMLSDADMAIREGSKALAAHLYHAETLEAYLKNEYYALRAASLPALKRAGADA